MNETHTKPNVAPPASYKAPSLPTLAALGAIAAAALAGGCKKTPMYDLGGDVYAPEPEPAETQNNSEEKNEPFQLRGERSTLEVMPVESR